MLPPSRRRLWALVALLAAAVAAGAAVVVGATRATDAGAARPLLPDLVQRSPYRLTGATVAARGGPRFRLGFASAVDNLGAGPMLVSARRPHRAAPAMTARQQVAYTDGKRRAGPRIGTLRYVRSPDHAHWHLLPFERYSLLPLERPRGRPARSYKTGFCLGDRYDSRRPDTHGAKPAAPVWTDECGRDRPELLELWEGISVGYGDDYDPQLEGQFVDVTGLPAGRYELLHEVNVGRSIRELDYRNNAASIVIRLTWPKGRGSSPRVDVLRRCGDGRRCRPDS